jgi:hypothetical protein
MSMTNRTERHKRQAEFLRYFKEVGFQAAWIANVSGRLLLYSEKEDNISVLASSDVRAVVQSLCTLCSSGGRPTDTLIFTERQLS